MKVCRYILLLVCCWGGVVLSQARQDQLLNDGWYTAASETDTALYDGFVQTTYATAGWQPVSVPHNWDDYHGYRRKLHGNLHGTAWYRRSFQLARKEAGKRYFLFFEGVGSYATVWLNGRQIGYHAGGRTTFTIDITGWVLGNNRQNMLAVKAAHPAFIKDLPWVCGGCSAERGFSEGSQPMGIFRPVHLITTNEVRVEPFGVHAWNDTTVTTEKAIVHYENAIRNYSGSARQLTMVNRLKTADDKVVAAQTTRLQLAAGQQAGVRNTFPAITEVRLWSLTDPYLYTIETTVLENGRLLDRQEIPYGIRWIRWPIGRKDASNRFYLNGNPVFINGIAEYEHLLGSSHAFAPAQVQARISQVKAAGFNAFRDAHQPHALLYQQLLDEQGLLWWTQFSAHVWYDSPAFRQQFKDLLREWVVERRNCPSLVLWGLQNESKLPADFAAECSQLIRSLDPTSSAQRLITTCNGGSGTDWDVPQNWTGTYGGDPGKYADDVKRQVLIGEYGAWRTLGLHTEGPFVAGGPLSEDRMTQLMEQKVRLAESVRDSSCGQFFWLLTSHDNPGRVQGGEGYRELDRIGPVNYKGLLTPWEEPADAFYMFRSHYASPKTDPMVYIVSHTWPDRWTSPGKKDSIIVYSNCDEVELFNDIDGRSLGRKQKGRMGTHLQWDGVEIRYNVLVAKGYVNGKPVAEDLIRLNHLPEAPGWSNWLKKSMAATAKKAPRPVRAVVAARREALVRINCGGPAYTDLAGNHWQADQAWDSAASSWGSLSWTSRFPGMPPYFASQRTFSNPVAGTADQALYQDFRYGRQDLQYRIPVPDGKYQVELHFAEPWWGTGGVNAAGYRLFDVAINGETVIRNLDLYREAGCRTACQKTVAATADKGLLTITFPKVAAGQAVIAAIAIFPDQKGARPVPAPASLIREVTGPAGTAGNLFHTQHWLRTGDTCYTNEPTTFSALPPELYGAEWIQANRSGRETIPFAFRLSRAADVYVAIADTARPAPAWLHGYEALKAVLETDAGGKTIYRVYRKRISKDALVKIGVAGAPVAAGLVCVQPASSLEPPYDLKPTASYRPATALLQQATRDSVNGRESIRLNGPESFLEWPVETGVADIYSLTIRYANTTGQPGTGTLTLLAADGTQMMQETIRFVPSPRGKWNYITTNTGSQINAGHYRVRITGAGMQVSGLDVQ